MLRFKKCSKIRWPLVISAVLLRFQSLVLVGGQKRVEVDAAHKCALAKMNDGQVARVNIFIQFRAADPEILGRV